MNPQVGSGASRYIHEGQPQSGLRPLLEVDDGETPEERPSAAAIPVPDSSAAITASPDQAGQFGA